MLLTSAIVPLLSASFSLAAPATHVARQGCDLITIIDYYQGSSTGDCGVEVSAGGSITAGVCLNVETQGVVVHSLPDNDCTVKLFFGSKTCGDGVDATSTTEVPAGNGTSCIVTGVEEPPWYTGSLLMSCDC